MHPFSLSPAALAAVLSQLRLRTPLPPDPLEDWHQRQIIYLAALHEKEWPDLTWLAHVPNGGLREDGAGQKLKQQGVRAGYEYLLMDVPRRDVRPSSEVCGVETGGVRMGWRGELKRYRNGKPSDEQEDWLALPHVSQGGIMQCDLRVWKKPRRIFSRRGFLLNGLEILFQPSALLPTYYCQPITANLQYSLHLAFLPTSLRHRAA